MSESKNHNFDRIVAFLDILCTSEVLKKMVPMTK